MNKKNTNEPSMENEFYFQWHITERCNWRCKHCYHEDYKQEGELSSIQLISIIEKFEEALAAWGKKAAVSVTGGEPWIRADDVKNILERIEGSPYFNRVDLLTNGSLLTDEDCLYLASKKKLRRVQVSIEGSTAERNDEIRGPGSFEKILAIIRKLVRHNIKVGVMMTIAQYNYDDVLPTIEMLSNEGVETFALERFMPTGQSTHQKDKTLTTEQVKEVFRKVNNWSRTHSSPRVLQYRPLFCMLEDDSHVGAMCSVGENALSILHDGTILPCRRLPMPLGNILKDNLIQLWAESQFLWTVRRPSGLNAKCSHCPDIIRCRGCRAMAYAVTGNWLAPDPHCWRTVNEKYSGPRLKDEINFVWPKLTDIHFIYSTKTGVTLEVEEAGYSVLNMLDGFHSEEELVTRLQGLKGCSRQDAESGISSLLAQLKDSAFLDQH